MRNPGQAASESAAPPGVEESNQHTPRSCETAVSQLRGYREVRLVTSDCEPLRGFLSEAYHLRHLRCPFSRNSLTPYASPMPFSPNSLTPYLTHLRRFFSSNYLTPKPLGLHILSFSKAVFLNLHLYIESFPFS